MSSSFSVPCLLPHVKLLECQIYLFVFLFVSLSLGLYILPFFKRKKRPKSPKGCLSMKDHDIFSKQKSQTRLFCIGKLCENNSHQLKRNDMGEESNVVLHSTPFYYLLLSIRDGNINMPTVCLILVSRLL